MDNQAKDNLYSFSEIVKTRAKVKPPTYEWQDLALRVIKELGIPNFKRSAVFKVCKNNPAIIVERALSDTKELCSTGSKWQYFFKIIDHPQSGGYRPKSIVK